MALDGKTVGLALSGGGFRAALFGLGSLWRLNEAGLLGRLDRISSVSGGSILAGLLAHRWRRLDFVAGHARNFKAEVADPLRVLCDKTIDVSAGIKGLVTPFKSAGEYLADCYDKHLFHKATTHDMPDPANPGEPRFVLYATNMQTGRSFRIRQDMLADWKLGVARGVSIPLAQAVAASSAFPPVFSPIIIKTDPAKWADGENIPHLDQLRSRIVLADGGVYDNMGLETLIGKVDLVLVSDAGAPFEIELAPPETPLQMGRVRDILIDQTRALRKRWLIDDFTAGRRHGAYWGLDTKIGDYADSLMMAGDNKITDSLAQVPTRLSGFGGLTEGRLINWGYALADAALRTRAGLAIAPSKSLPVPDAALS
ncbi:patatin-like phospholipase family protein [Pseudomonas sp. 57B-090624]|uniref:patatin-like phospholipase family protein n=1 Tax=Pseudomonas sp. 57B-090624 TaxID=2213080 RepID=UPI000DA7D1D6|nr:patatin-like phospholipase family protein [Pseudomonas sp. 57B-090624]PZE11145.1 patatin-like phospholipase family protein [Pseudomonas sp. 57B-090624]